MYVCVDVSNLWVTFHEISLYGIYLFILLSSLSFVSLNAIEFAAQSNITTVCSLKPTVNLNGF